MNAPHSAANERREMTPRELTASIILIERDGNVTIPARTLAVLVSYALAGPSNESGRRYRDDVVERANQCFLDSWEASVIAAEVKS